MRFEINNDFFPGQIYFEGRVEFRSEKEKMILESLDDNLLNNTTLSDVAKKAIPELISFYSSDDYIYFAENLINEHTESSLSLISSGKNRVKVMAELRRELRVSLSRARELVNEDSPVISEGKKSTLIPIKNALEAVGATMKVVDKKKPDWPWVQNFNAEVYIGDFNS